MSDLKFLQCVFLKVSKRLQHCTEGSWELAVLLKNEPPRVLWQSQGSENESKV